ncbi:MAG: TIGR02281 family clan AA aspartic protease [Magnetococcus sp. YQC-5]
MATALHYRFVGPIFASNNTDPMGYAALSAGLLAWLLTSTRLKFLPALLKGIGIWLGVVLVLVLGYGLQPEWMDLWNRLLATAIPQKGFSQNTGSWNVQKSSDGHFYVELLVNHVPIRFLVDTGAGSIVLTRSAARQIGLMPDRLEYTLNLQTANGMTRGAPILLDELRLGDLTLHNMPATVHAGELHTCLLGMTFFKRLDSYEVKRNWLTLRWQGNLGS